ncbi:MAG: choice-of-anchor J domain-containing protein [Ginsengibacter sp.]
MKKSKLLLQLSFAIFLILGVIISCTKDELRKSEMPRPIVNTNPSFTEEFDSVGNLTSKGWVFKNNSSPLGQTGWRQGRYEAANQVKFTTVGPYIGFPAYSAHNTPNDFVSCDVSCLTDVDGFGGNISAWLISPELPMSNGDKIVFYSRATNDALYNDPATDRMQVRANFTDGKADVGKTALSVGSFSTLLLDINANRVYNNQGGYPSVWTKYTIILSGVPGGKILDGRFAFRYYNEDAGLQGGSGVSGTYYNPTVVGIDSLAFVHQ